MVLYVVPVHAAHDAAPSLSTTRPFPAAQAAQPIRAPTLPVAVDTVTTFGDAHAVHSTPNAEYVAPTQSTSAVRAWFGDFPAGHAEQLRWAASTIYGFSQFSQIPVVEYVVPTQDSQAILDSFGCVLAGHGKH